MECRRNTDNVSRCSASLGEKERKKKELKKKNEIEFCLVAGEPCWRGFWAIIATPLARERHKIDHKVLLAAEHVIQAELLPYSC